MDINAMLNKYQNVFTKPVETFKAEKKKANLKDGAIQIAIALIASAVIAGIIQIVQNVLGIAITTTISQLIGGPAGFVAASGTRDLVSSILGTILWDVVLLPLHFLALLVFAGVIFLVAKHAFKGSGEYGTQYGLMALYYAPILVISALLGIIPCLGPLAGLALNIYGLYLLTLVMKETHQLDITNALLSWLIPAIIVAVIVIVISMLLTILGLLSLAAFVTSIGNLMRGS